MNRDARQDQISDPVLAAAMAELRSDVPHDVDWDGLRRAINDDAELLLARKRARWKSFVPRPVLPIAIAASVAFALWVGPSAISQLMSSGEPVEIAIEVDEEQLLMEALGSDLTEQEFRLLVTGRANPEALLAFAIGER